MPLSCFSAEGKSAFQLGVEAYRLKNWKDAEIQFQNHLKAEPKSAEALLNLALVEFELNKKGHALAYLRHALALDPKNAKAHQALSYLKAQGLSPATKSDSFFAILNSSLIRSLSLDTLLGFSLLVLLIWGFLLFRYLQNRRRALSQETAPPPFPTVLILIFLFLITSAILSTWKLWDSSLVRGTVLQAGASLRAGPGETEVTLLELPEGAEVRLLLSRPPWNQVRNEEGSTGWIHSQQIYFY